MSDDLNGHDRLNRRNTMTIAQQVRGLVLKIEEQEERINGLNRAMSQMIARLEVLENDRAMRLAQRMGNGPSVPGG